MTVKQVEILISAIDDRVKELIQLRGERQEDPFIRPELAELRKIRAELLKAKIGQLTALEIIQEKA